MQRVKEVEKTSYSVRCVKMQQLYSKINILQKRFYMQEVLQAGKIRMEGMRGVKPCEGAIKSSEMEEGQKRCNQVLLLFGT